MRTHAQRTLSCPFFGVVTPCVEALAGSESPESNSYFFVRANVEDQDRWRGGSQLPSPIFQLVQGQASELYAGYN